MPRLKLTKANVDRLKKLPHMLGAVIRLVNSGVR